jgi:Fic family protein
MEYQRFIVDKFNPQDFVEYNEILFAAHSCAIEGNTFSVNDTRELKEKGLEMIPHGKTLYEAFEILDHFRAYEYLLNNLDKPLSEGLLKHTHKLLTEHTLLYRIKDAVPGEYTHTDMAAGDTVFGDHTQLIPQVPKLLDSTRKEIEKGNIHPVILSARFHCYFEYLHPFRDGNGRIGRLFSNYILLKMNKPLIIIKHEDKAKYIQALRQYKKERSDEHVIYFFFDAAIGRMKQEIEEKKNLSHTCFIGIEKIKDEHKLT